MTSIRDQKLIYHLTSLRNLGSILDSGLQPRSALSGFHDVANAEILAGRQAHQLENYVPFHWFAKNPFDGRVQIDRPDEDFVLIAVHRSLARARNWKVIPRHPLGNGSPLVLDYEAGFDQIDWNTMDRRDYQDHECKSICMAECLSPQPVLVESFYMIFVPNGTVAVIVANELECRDISIEIRVNGRMFH
jgi:hypothetical protein